MNDIDPKMLARIQKLRLMDDDFMTVIFAGNNKLTELLLRILLSRDDLTVKSSMSQKTIHNIYGRSVRLDILAEDTSGKLYNVEIQRADKGADEHRVRFNQSMIDHHSFEKSKQFSALPDLYIIFITENDYFGRHKPIYKVKKTIEGTSLSFDDGCHIMYVNGAYCGHNEIGHLMHDFRESDAKKMYFSEIADSVRFHKQESKGVKSVCRIVEEYGDERVAERNLQVAEKLLKESSFSEDKISEISEIPLERVKQMAESMKVLS